MRKQYHFRQVGQDTYIWDVHHLIGLSQNLPIQHIELSKIKELDECYWYSNQSPTTRQIAEHFRLVNEADLNYPIILCANGRVMDGMHRVVKAYLNHATQIQAVQFTQTPPANFINVAEDALAYDD